MAIHSTTKPAVTPEEAEALANEARAQGKKVKALSSFSVPVFNDEVLEKYDGKIVPAEWIDDQSPKAGLFFGFNYNGKALPFALFTKVRYVITKEGDLKALQPNQNNWLVKCLNEHPDTTKENFEAIATEIKKHINKTKMHIEYHDTYKNGGYQIATYELINKLFNA